MQKEFLAWEAKLLTYFFQILYQLNPLRFMKHGNDFNLFLAHKMKLRALKLMVSDEKDQKKAFLKFSFLVYK